MKIQLIGKRLESVGEELFHCREAYSLVAQRDGGIEHLVPVEDTDLLFTVREDGFCDVQSFKEMQNLQTQSRSSSDPDVLILHGWQDSDGQTRGLIQSAIKQLEVFSLKDKLTEKLAEAAGGICSESLCKYLDSNRFGPNEDGLVDLQSGGSEAGWYSPKKLSVDKAPTDPILLFLHGTLSSVEMAFAGLGVSSHWTELQKQYDSRIWGFNHKTLSVSPLENCVDLLESLPPGCTLDIVSHSRGGLIADLLCLSPGRFTDYDRSLFKSTQEKLFERYSSLLVEKCPRVRRSIRVGCPARGTTLASGRLDTYLKTLLNAVSGLMHLANPSGLDPTLAAAEKAFSFVKSCLLGFATLQKEKPSAVGLQAMKPDSELIQFLNRPDRTAVDTQLSIIAAKVSDASRWKEKISQMAADLFYLQNHDFVVPTASMSGGVTSNQGLVFTSQGPLATHFRYFSNLDTVAALLEALKGDRSRFAPLAVSSSVPSVDWSNFVFKSRGGEPSKRPVCFVVPGAMGSHLTEEGNYLWLSKLALVTGKFPKLRLPQSQAKPTGLLEDFYLDLCHSLAETHDVEIFPYDWRRSVFEEGARFLARVRGVVKALAPDQPVRIVCHSMGGLVTRAMMQLSQGWWKEAMSGRAASRILMLGVPNHGSMSAFNKLCGQDDFLTSLAWVDCFHDLADITETVRSFPGVWELLPNDDEGGWRKELTGNLPMLELHDQTWDKLRDVIDTERMIYVAGTSRDTPWRLTAVRNVGGGLNVAVCDKGDGTVPWDRGKLPGVPVYFNERADHGNLPCDKQAFPAYLELLTEGKTSKLSTNPPDVKKLRGCEIELSHKGPLLYPDFRDLQASAMGGSRRLPAGEKQKHKRVEVQVVHGDLKYSQFPVVIGHYQEQPLEGSELALDGRLDGRLSRDRSLGIYPGPIGTRRLILESGSGESGAIVVGLGSFGSLSPGALTRALQSAIKDYLVHRGDSSAQNAVNGLSFVLIGSMEGGVGMEQAVYCLLDAVVEANFQLAREPKIRGLSRIEIVELLEDRAIEAAHSLVALCRNRKFATVFQVATMKVATGGLRRISPLKTARSWQRIEIVRDDEGSLQFTTFGESSSNHVTSLKLNEALLSSFLDSVASSPTWDPKVAKTLFELLLPRSLKASADDERPLLLLLDSSTAKYPWELLVSDLSGAAAPAAVRSALIRQLSTEYFREKVPASAQPAALVVGDPPSDFAPLPAARAEARQVAQLLSESFLVEYLDQPSTAALLSSLFARPLQILHLSGHGVYEFRDGQPFCGMVIGKGLYLTPATVAQLQICPEVVFVNCCHLGRLEETEARYPDLASNLAVEFIRMGARVVVAAGWAVEDKSARLFATEFYSHMLQNVCFGEAVLRARRAVYDQFPTWNTWGAYQCYGDPDYVLLSASQRSSSSSEWHKRSPVAVSEVLADLDNLRQASEVAAPQQREALFSKAADILNGAKSAGLYPDKGSLINVALARLYRELVDAHFGINCKSQGCEPDDALDRALDFAKLASGAPSWSIEDVSLTNRLLLLKFGFYKLEAAQTALDRKTLMIAAVDSRRQLAKLLSNNGKAWSRVAGGLMLQLLSPFTTDKAEIKQLLAEMLDNYKTAVRLGDDDFDRDMEFLTALALSELSGNNLKSGYPKVLESRLAQLVEGAEFFDFIKRIRYLILLWAHNQAPPDRWPEILFELTSVARHRGGSPFKLRSVLELLDFLRKISSLVKSKKQKTDALESALKDVLGLV